ncbi:MAG TPA: hemolysin III family protein [Propionibacteriaceae bacterium]|nr:hemolysin III family protein [Propionibacteriaceae bacterium]
MSTGTPVDRGSAGGEPLDSVSDVLEAVKPRLRGWLHAAMTPLAVAAGVVLIALAPTELGRLGGAVFLVASVMLYGTSGLYHGFTWGRRGEAILRRIDHANIYLFIAATYTPFALMMLQGASRVLLLSVIWGAAIGGLLFRLFWLGAPRWLYTVLYLAMGWAAVAWFGQFWAAGGPMVFLLILTGGAFYTFGAVVYGLKRPNPFPRWFGFHEIFHACTIAAFAAHYLAISIITYRAG